MFLKGIMTTDGSKSIEIYKKILNNFPESRYASEAAVKIAEYYYSLGLYSQAGKHLSKIPRVYPRFPNIQRVIDLMVSSFIAIGEEDSAKYYANIYKSMFPTLNVDKLRKEGKSINYNNAYQKKSINKPYIIQAGAFSNFENANRMKLQISQIGYDVEISIVENKGLKLYAVRVIRYETKFEAEKVKVRTFIAPNHTFDNNTLLALKECGIKEVLDGYGLMPYSENEINFIPQLFHKIIKLPFGIQCFQIHLNYFNEKDFESFKNFIEQNSKKIITYEQAISKVNNSFFYKIIRIASKRILQIKRLN